MIEIEEDPRQVLAKIFLEHGAKRTTPQNFQGDVTCGLYEMAKQLYGQYVECDVDELLDILRTAIMVILPNYFPGETDFERDVLASLQKLEARLQRFNQDLSGDKIHEALQQTIMLIFQEQRDSIRADVLEAFWHSERGNS